MCHSLSATIPGSFAFTFITNCTENALSPNGETVRHRLIYKRPALLHWPVHRVACLHILVLGVAFRLSGASVLHLYVERLLGHLYHYLVKGGTHLLVVELLFQTVDFLAQCLRIFHLRVAMGLFYFSSTLLSCVAAKLLIMWLTANWERPYIFATWP